MHWLFGARRLKQLGILGMNHRNAACILDHNPRERYPIVDDKLRMRELCQEIGVPTPAVFAAVQAHSELCRLPRLLEPLTDFVLKPNRGSAGRGVLVILGRDGQHFIRHNGERLTLDEIRQHVSDLLSGMYSLGGRPDQAIVQQRVLLHPDFEPISHKGIPDIRVVLYRDEPAMAMLRLPTKESNGRANLHQGGIGAGVDLDSGRTNHAVQRNRFIERHPDTGQRLVGHQVPYWDKILDMSRRVAVAVGLGYVGVDIVVDAREGPLLLEANARPGLAIQIANGKGLLPRLQAIDAGTTVPVSRNTLQPDLTYRKSA
ncbi:MAG: alpha-L-glutamate ligase-like protein [Planctomycetia bacterium]|nr:alpha-L-glutamate ligase-like protein [Planctomycetia bacterium]